MADWMVWPIYIVQAMILIFLILPIKTRFLGISAKTVAILLSMMICLAILVSLYHDSTTNLHLYF